MIYFTAVINCMVMVVVVIIYYASRLASNLNPNMPSPQPK